MTTYINEDEKYKDENDKVHENENEEGKSWKTWLPIALMIIAIIIMAYFMFFRNGTDKTAEENTEETPTSTVIQDKTGEPRSSTTQGQGDEGDMQVTSTAPTTSEEVPGLAEQPPYPSELMHTEFLLPSTEPLTNPVPTTYRGPEVDEPYLFGPDGAPMDKAINIVSNMFSMQVKPENNYKKAFDEIIQKEGTERAKRLPFKQWWSGPADQHSIAWDVYANNPNKKSTLSNYILNEETKHIRDDMVQIDMEIGQTIMVQGGDYLRQPNFDFRMYMQYDPEKGWLIDDYSFPNEDKVPTFY